MSDTSFIVLILVVALGLKNRPPAAVFVLAAWIRLVRSIIIAGEYQIKSKRRVEDGDNGSPRNLIVFSHLLVCLQVIEFLPEPESNFLETVL
jgi:hypothetical protein